MSTRIEIKGLDRAIGLFDGLAEAVERPRELFNELADDFASRNRKTFAGDKLVETGKLRDSLTRRRLGVEQIGDREVTLGTDVEYAVYHRGKLGVWASRYEQAWRDRIARHLGEATR